MARLPRITNPEAPTVYHLISRSTLIGFPMGDPEKDLFMELVRKFSKIYFIEMLGFCCMGNHFHLLVRMFPDHYYSNENISQRFRLCYGRHRKLLEGQMPYFRERWSNLSEFMKEIKSGFTRVFNRWHDHQGYFWGDRFKSVIVEDGDALLNCLAYIDLNPVRAGLVKRPENYRWSSIGWHMQTGNKDGFLSLNLGVAELSGGKNSDRLRHYRKFLYEIGSLDTPKGARLAPEILENERKKDFVISPADRFRYRSKYFTDSGIIGSEQFVRQIYGAVKHRLPGKREKIPQEIKGLDGIFSLKKIKDHEPDLKSGIERPTTSAR